jgi:hypothetical protein
VETGSNLDRDRGSLFVDVLPVAEGVLSLPFHLRRGQARGKCRGFSCSSSFFSLHHVRGVSFDLGDSFSLEFPSICG